MNFNWTTLALFLLLATNVSAQLTLERADGKRLKHVQIGADLTLQVPPISSTADKAHHKYNGKLDGVRENEVLLNLTWESQAGTNDLGVFKRIWTRYPDAGPATLVPVPTNDVVSIVLPRKHAAGLADAGAYWMLFAVFHGLVTAPLLTADARKVSDKIVWATLAVGITMVAWPSEKTYYLQQPKGKKKRLWKIKSP